MDEISEIGEVSWEKKEYIEQVNSDYGDLLESQRKLVTNDGELRTALQKLNQMEYELQEAQAVAEVFLQGIVNKDFDQMKKVSTPAWENSDEAKWIRLLFFEEDLWGAGLVSTLTSGLVSYDDLSYVSRNVIDQIVDEAVLGNIATKYEVTDITYDSEHIIVNADIYGNIVETDTTVVDMINSDLEKYVEQNTSWLQYSIYGKSYSEIMITILDMAFIQYGSSWIRNISYCTKKTEKTDMSLLIEKIDGEWKVSGLVE